MRGRAGDREEIMDNRHETLDYKKPGEKARFNKIETIIVFFLAIVFCAILINNLARNKQINHKQTQQKTPAASKYTKDQLKTAQLVILKLKVSEMEGQIAELQKEKEGRQAPSLRQASLTQKEASRIARENAESRRRLQGEIERLKEEIVGFQGRIAQDEGLKERNARLEEEVASRAGQVARLKLEKQDEGAKTQGAGKEGLIADLKKSVTELKSKNLMFASAIKRSSSWKKTADRALKQNEAIQKQNGDFKKQIAQLQQVNRQIELNYKKLKNVNAQLEAKAKGLYLKTQELQQTRKNLDDILKAVEPMNRERLALRNENAALKERIVLFENSTKADIANLYYELGNAYMQANMFDPAIDAFAKSLKFKPGNADAHYKLGLLYKHTQDAPQKSVYHLKNYLKLSPEAKNKKEVDYLIEMLSAK